MYMKRYYTKPTRCFLAIFFCWLICGCQKETFNTVNEERPAPFITLPATGDGMEAYAGMTVNAVLLLEAQAGIAQIRVARNGELIETIEGISGQVSREYRIEQSIAEDAEVGSTIVYHLVLEDRQHRLVEQHFTISVIEAPPIPDFEFEDVTIGGHPYKLIQQDINVDVTLSSDYDYLLRGRVALTQGATLTIEAGTHIYAESESALIVSTGTKLMATGTPQEPIRFTSLAERLGSPNSGDWVGIFIHGLAPVTTVNRVVADNIGAYGGSNNADDSGTLSYVEISYAGALAVSGGGQELNAALNLNGVGNATRLEYIYVNEAGLSRTGVLAAGGTVGIKYLFINNPNGRAFVWKNGYAGFIQFLVATYTSNPTNAFTAIDGFGETGTASGPIISNVSIRSLGGTTFGNTRGIRFRENAVGKIYNCWITNVRDGVRADAGNLPLINSGRMVFANSRQWGNSNNNYINDANPAFAAASFHNSEVAPAAPWAGYVGIFTATDSTPLDPTALDPWFNNAAYIGAVDPDNNWTAGWINVTF